MGDSGVDAGDPISRRRLLTAAGTGAVTAVAGCSGDDGGDPGTGSTTPPPQSGGTLRVGFESALTGLDPHATSSVVSWQVIFNTCETLITFDDREPADRLATAWDISDDGLEYTFTLREGVTFHPPVDRELVAEDVVYSFERMAQPEAKGGDLAAMDSVDATGRYEVRFTMDEPFAPFFNFLARVSWVIIPEEAVENQGGSLGDFQRPVGTGPFTIGEYQPGNFLNLDAFDDHWTASPYLDRVQIQPIPDGDARVASVRAGDIDIARAIPGNDAGTIENATDVTLVQEPGSAWAQVHINCSKEPWSNPAVRRAVAHIIDRSAIVDAGVFGYGTAAWQPYPNDSVWHFELGATPREPDVDRAHQILKDAGNPLEDETLTIETNNQYQIMQSTADLLVAQLNQAGIDAETMVNEWGTQLTRFVQTDYTCQAFSVPYKIDPDRHYYPFLAPDGPQYNQYTPDQPDADRMYDLVQTGRSTIDQDTRIDTYTELQQLVTKNVPWISVARTDDLVGVRSNVYGYELWTLPYTRWWPLYKVSD